MLFYCSEFAPFTLFQKKHLHFLNKQSEEITLLFLNATFSEIKTQLYMKQIFNVLGKELPYQQITLEQLATIGGTLYFDGLLEKKLIAKFPENVFLPIEEIFGYEKENFADVHIFDDIPQSIADFIIGQELFAIDRNMGLVYNNMNYKRFQHTMRVRYLIKDLAIKYQLNVSIAEFTALFHDYAKDLPEEELSVIMEQYFPSYSDAPKAIWHGFAGALLLEQLYGDDIQNDDIYEAIEFHPIGIPHYSKLGLALFIADFCDYRRTFTAETQYVWQEAQKSLYLGAYAKIKSIQTFFEKKHQKLYWTTENMLEWLEEELKMRGNK